MGRVERFTNRKLPGLVPLETTYVKRKSLTGFTLIELVIVVALLAILVSVAAVAFQNITEKAQIANVKANLKRVRSAIFIQKADNELNNSRDDGTCGPHPRINFWPTFEEVRKASYAGQLEGSILETMMPPNPFIDSPPARNPPFDNNFVANCSNATVYSYPSELGSNNANNLVVATNVSKGFICPAANCEAGWAYNPSTGEFWANSGTHDSNNW